LIAAQAWVSYRATRSAGCQSTFRPFTIGFALFNYAVYKLR
jgi:hypothetical protein